MSNVGTALVAPQVEIGAFTGFGEFIGISILMLIPLCALPSLFPA